MWSYANELYEDVWCNCELEKAVDKKKCIQENSLKDNETQDKVWRKSKSQRM